MLSLLSLFLTVFSLDHPVLPVYSASRQFLPLSHMDQNFLIFVFSKASHLRPQTFQVSCCLVSSAITQTRVCLKPTHSLFKAVDWTVDPGHPRPSQVKGTKQQRLGSGGRLGCWRDSDGQLAVGFGAHWDRRGEAMIMHHSALTWTMGQGRMRSPFGYRLRYEPFMMVTPDKGNLNPWGAVGRSRAQKTAPDERRWGYLLVCNSGNHLVAVRYLTWQWLWGDAPWEGRALGTGKEWGTIIELKVVESLVRVLTDTKIFYLERFSHSTDQ